MGVKKLIHLSKTNLDGKTLYPRVPDNYMTRVGAEDGKISRVCFAKDIDGALAAIGTNLKGQVLYVHQPIITDKTKIISNEEIINKKYTPDAEITGEIWTMTPVKLRVVGMIKVIEATTPRSYVYYVNGEEKTAELWLWKYSKMNLPRFILKK